MNLPPPILVVGASFAEPGSPFVAELDRQLGAVGAGVRGASLDRWLTATLARSDLRGRTVVVLELGGNGVAGTAVIEAADAALKARGALPFWVMPPRWPSGTRVEAARSQAARNLDAARVDVLRAGWAPVRADLAPDEVHLTPVGYRAFARAVVPTLTGIGGEGYWTALATLAVVLVLAFTFGGLAA